MFLRYMGCFEQIENVQINRQTIDLMQEAIAKMKSLSQRAQIIENSARNDVNFLCDLNEDEYIVQRYILCRTCCVS